MKRQMVAVLLVACFWAPAAASCEALFVSALIGSPVLTAGIISLIIGAPDYGKFNHEYSCAPAPSSACCTPVIGGDQKIAPQNCTINSFASGFCPPPETLFCTTPGGTFEGPYVRQEWANKLMIAGAVMTPVAVVGILIAAALG